MPDENSSAADGAGAYSAARRRLVDIVQEMQSKLEYSQELLRAFDDAGPPADNEVEATALIIRNNEILTHRILNSFARLWSSSAATSLEEMEGIGPEEAAELRKAGVDSVEALLQAGGQRSARRRLARATGFPAELILRWVNQADLFRITGVGGVYAELLEVAGIDSVPELARRDADRLAAALTQVNADRRLERRVPGAHLVRSWISDARTLPKAVEH
jgi:predicted flap endonuclease-1-like 5' DNA nuclease